MFQTRRLHRRMAAGKPCFPAQDGSRETLFTWIAHRVRDREKPIFDLQVMALESG